MKKILIGLLMTVGFSGQAMAAGCYCKFATANEVITQRADTKSSAGPLQSCEPACKSFLNNDLDSGVNAWLAHRCGSFAIGIFPTKGDSKYNNNPATTVTKAGKGTYTAPVAAVPAVLSLWSNFMDNENIEINDILLHSSTCFC